MDKNLKCKIRYGFTLIEMLISITIFMIFAGLIGSSYTSLISANRKANDIQKLYREVRNVFDTLASEIRSGTIDYSCYEDTKDPICLTHLHNLLSLLHEDGIRRSLFTFDASKKQILLLRQLRSNSKEYSVWVTEEADWQPLTALTINDFSLRIFPNKNPYTHAKQEDIQLQPAVTLQMTTNGYSFRTTYSSRTYGKTSLY